ncbi:MAG: hypothetical protein EOM59_12735 [Clostridia bacterium]|nr:hypothetical protein [Clostridia bacterium]
MTDLYEPPCKRSIEKTFLGKRIGTDEIVEKEIEIHDFEIGIGRKSGNPVAYCQIRIEGEWRMWWTEGYKIIRRLERANRAQLPFRTKVGWDEEQKYLIFKKI